ncbi:MAG TPA: hypothetical protein VG095_09725, partial [Chthoniobacterales bacterium]|nr:hypothetical protein [Chthoniobacterales bacterium]
MTVKEFRLKLRMLAVIALALSITPESLSAYVLDAERWTRNRTVVMQLSLGPPQALLDGSTSFNQVAQEALNAWNTHLAHLGFGSVVDSPVPPGSNDNEMSVFFSSTVFGESFGNNVLAVTLVSSRG